MAFNWLKIIAFQDGTQLAEDITPPPKVTGEEETYVVGQGDTLLSISYEKYRNHSDWDAIATFNGIIDPYDLEVGTVLLIPILNGTR